MLYMYLKYLFLLVCFIIPEKPLWGEDNLLKQFIVIFSLFLVFKVFDEDNDSNLNVKEWVFGLSKFLRGTFKEQTDCN